MHRFVEKICGSLRARTRTLGHSPSLKITLITTLGATLRAALLIGGGLAVLPASAQVQTQVQPQAQVQSQVQAQTQTQTPPPQTTAIFLAPDRARTAEAGSMVADGSATAPFYDVARAVEAAARGDGLILLQAGHYGAATWQNLRPDTAVRLQAQTRGAVHFDRLALRNAHNLHLVDFFVWPRADTPDPQAHRPGPLVRSEDSSQLIFEGFELRSRDTARDYMNWSKTDWSTRAHGGFLLNGRTMTARNNTVIGVSHGIATTGPGAQVIGNQVMGFSGDALRGVGNHSQFIGNRVQDCVKIDDNHDDGFQSWSPRTQQPDAEISDLRLISNTILEWTGPAHHPLRCRLQGIGLFDGFYRDLVILNNLIVVEAYHGIALYGGIDSVIAHNTVVRPRYGRSAQAPWIAVSPHRNGTPSRNIQVYNNAAMSYQNLPNALKYNASIRAPARLFRAPDAGDYSPHPDGPLVDAAPLALAAPDLYGTPRPQGGRADLGAIEARP